MEPLQKHDERKDTENVNSSENEATNDEMFLFQSKSPCLRPRSLALFLQSSICGTFVLSTHGVMI